MQIINNTTGLFENIYLDDEIINKSIKNQLNRITVNRIFI